MAIYGPRNSRLGTVTEADTNNTLNLERIHGTSPSSPVWKTGALILSYTRNSGREGRSWTAKVPKNDTFTACGACQCPTSRKFRNPRRGDGAMACGGNRRTLLARDRLAGVLIYPPSPCSLGFEPKTSPRRANSPNFCGAGRLFLSTVLKTPRPPAKLNSEAALVSLLLFWAMRP